MPEIIIESIPRIQGKKGEGIALLPGISQNGFLYEKNVITSAENIGKPLSVFWDHDQSKPIGSVTFSVDNSIPLLRYSLEITDPNYNIVEGVHRVSIDADGYLTRRCNPENCFKIVENLKLKGISITDQPSVIGASLSVITETLSNWNEYKPCKCDECKIKESENEKVIKLENEIIELKSKFDKATTCKNCGKHKHL